MICTLIGNQNSGKTTLFNELTGSNQKVGNWPGVTIEKKEGKLKGTDISIIDLPGIYSLSPYTKEEEVSRKFLFNESPDLLINIIDATSIERSLYLTTQLLELDTDVVIALNMEDILEKNGIKINLDGLSRELGCSIVSISAKNGTNIDRLINLISSKEYIKNSHKEIYPEDVERLIKNISDSFTENITNKRFAAVKIIEHDMEYHVLNNIPLENESQKIEEKYDMDGEQLIASLRYSYIESVRSKTVSSKEINSITDKLDKIFLNKYAAIPIFILIMAFVYLLTIGVGGELVKLIEKFFSWVSVSLSDFITSKGGSSWAKSLVVDGIVGGVGAVCDFIPQIIILFALLSILETSGYMSRISFFLDRVFHKFGLSGKSLVPFIVGSGCSVPAIMTCRTIEDKDERHVSIMLTPFIPCNAKLPIITLFTTFIVGGGAFQKFAVSFSLYVLAFALILLFGFLLKKVYKGHESTFVSELPQYKLPSIKYVLRDVFDKTIAFIKRAGSVILICSIVVWFFASFTWKFNYIDGITYTLENSILASIGNVFAWFFYIMLGGNWSWAASVSAIQGLIAKEQVVSSMTVIAGLSGSSLDGSVILSSGVFSGIFTPITAYAFMLFNLFSAPCVGAISAMRKELGSFKATIKAVLFQIGIGWALGSAVGLIQLLISL